MRDARGFLPRWEFMLYRRNPFMSMPVVPLPDEGDDANGGGGVQPAPEPVKPSEDPKPQGDPDALGDGGKKALDAERKAREAAEKKLREYERKQMNDQERAQSELKEAREELERVRSEAVRARIQARYGIGDDDAETFLTSGDPEVLERVAKRLSEKLKAAAVDESKPRAPRPDPSQGSKGGGAGKDTVDAGRSLYQQRKAAKKSNPFT